MITGIYVLDGVRDSKEKRAGSGEVLLMHGNEHEIVL